MALSPYPPKIEYLTIRNNVLVEENEIHLAISGPQIVSDGKNVVDQIPVRTRESGQTIGNEINYSPFKDRTSFTAFGVASDGEFIAVSMFSGKRIQRGNLVTFRVVRDTGITMNEMADLLIELGAREGIAGGGSGDTQQYVKNHGTWVSEPRFQMDRGQVQGIRGLGAILCISTKSNEQ